MEILYWFGMLCFLVNLIYWVALQRTVGSLHDQTEYGPELPSTTVLVVARNAAHHLKAHLPALLDQDHPDLQLLVADDGSDSEDLKVVVDGLPDVEYQYYDKQTPGKKGTLAKALETVKTECVVLTDADCAPSSQLWARKMSETLGRHRADVVLGYAPLRRVNGRLLTSMARFETVLTALQYFSWAAWGKPYMAVGRNVAYRTAITKNFLERSRPHVTSGDDDLFVQAVSANTRFTTTLDEDTLMYSNPPDTWRKWFHQKARHVSTSYHYDTMTKLGLMGFAITQIGWWVGVLLSGSFWWVLLIFRYVVLSVTGISAFGRLKGRDLLYLRPVLELMLVVYYVVLLPASLFRNKEW